MVEKLIKVIYPLAEGEMILRTDKDWNLNINPIEVYENVFTFKVESDSNRTFFYFKPCIFKNQNVHWSIGGNYLFTNSYNEVKEIYPYFFAKGGGSISEIFNINSKNLGMRNFRIYFPPGYEENYLKKYPVLYMQDGQNIFSPFSNSYYSWGIDDTLNLLDNFNIVDKVIVVGIYSEDRFKDFTNPGYYLYGELLAKELKNLIDNNCRTLIGPNYTAIMGSSLGGVVSMFMCWNWPDIFGMGACLSSTFGWRDNLNEIISTKKRKPGKIYIDSGKPDPFFGNEVDNFEVSKNMRDLLTSIGYSKNNNLMYLSFPDSIHSEKYWSTRFHIPFQFLFGK